LVLIGVLAPLVAVFFWARRFVAKAGLLKTELETSRQHVAQLEGRLRVSELEQHKVQALLEKQRELQQIQIEVLEKSRDELTTQLGSAQAQVAQRQQDYLILTEKHARLSTSLSERDKQHQVQLAQFSEQKKVLQKEFENLANRIFEEKGKTFTHSSKESLEGLLKPFREQISDFRNRVDGIHKENNESAGSLKKELEQLRKLNQDMTTDAKNLTEALKGDKKKLGSWGEVQLEKTLQLAGLIKDDHYQSQAHFKDSTGKNNFPDFVVKLPDDKHIVIDSKVSLVDYDCAISAETDAELNSALDAHAKAIKNHIDGLAAKDYTNLIGIHSPSFVLMFMPIEPAYIEAMRHSKELYNYGYQKGVILVSHTTLMPILRTVVNLWMVEQSNAEAREISDRAGEVYNQVCLLAERLHKLGGSIQTVGKQYNNAVVALAGQQGLHGKIERFNRLSNKVTKSMPAIQAIHSDIEMDRLEVTAIQNEMPPSGLEQETVGDVDSDPVPGNT